MVSQALEVTAVYIKQLILISKKSISIWAKKSISIWAKK